MPLIPAVFRYSRIGWIYFERAGCPSDISATVYEKTRLQEQRGHPLLTPIASVEQRRLSDCPDDAGATMPTG